MIMDRSAITHVRNAIHNPDDPLHFMRLKPTARRITIRLGDLVLAETTAAHRLLEAGRDLYDPVFYVPAGDVRVGLEPVDRTTHCPIKGDTTYYDAVLPDGTRIAELAWCYTRPLPFVPDMTGLVAFDPKRTTIVDAPLD